MNIIDALKTEFETLFTRKPSPTKPAKGLHCADCHQPIRKHELFKVVSARHRNCACPAGGNVPKQLIDFIDEGM